MKKWIVGIGIVSFIFGLGFLSPANAESPRISESSLRNLDTEAKVIEKLKNLAAGEVAIAKSKTSFTTPRIGKLEGADRFLYSVQPNVRLVLKLSDRRVVVYEDDQIKVTYPVAVGKSGWETPKGKFQVSRLERNPTWQSPWTNKISPAGDNNPIGSRWIGFWTNGKDEIGFHGTPNEGSIGQAASHGCVRMLNSDVKKLFEMVSLGTKVEVIP
jgi:lipoprotein-anchoring transpeptidase ErfK/SrfK